MNDPNHKETLALLEGVAEKVVENLRAIALDVHPITKPVVVCPTEKCDTAYFKNKIERLIDNDDALKYSDLKIVNFDAENINYNSEYINLITSLPCQGGILCIKNINGNISELGQQCLRDLLMNKECRISTDGSTLTLNNWAIAATLRKATSRNDIPHNNVIRGVGCTIFFLE